MPTLRKPKPKPDAAKTYVAVIAFVSDIPPNFVAYKGMRLRGDHPAVQAHFHLFADESTPDDELAQRFSELYFGAPAEAVEQVPVPVERRLRLEDAVVHVDTGERLARNSQAVKDNPKQFVAVVPDGVRRENAYLALATMRHLSGGVERVVYRGQLVDRDDPLTRLHPHQFQLPPLAA